MNKIPLQLSEDFKAVIHLIEKEGKNVFITGRAGTGKSTLLQLFKNTTKKNVVVLAPTGVAALNVGGMTIHSFFKFPAKPIAPSDIKPLKNPKLYKSIQTIVIDEISMVRADLLDNIDTFLRVNRKNPLPFGGVQMIFFGDLFQLPPVIGSDAEQTLISTLYGTPYFFAAHVFQLGFELEKIELRKIYRQSHRHFMRLLEAIRLNQIDRDDLDELNQRYFPYFQSDQNYITLSARNSTVDEINSKALDTLPTEAKLYHATVNGTFDAKLFPTEAVLKLKVGAQVMFIKNDPDGRFVNGTIGKVTQLKESAVSVSIQDGNNGNSQVIDVESFKWEIQEYTVKAEDPEKISSEVLGSFIQFPLKLAWAITIHKSQGKTFDKVIIDFGRGAFEHGQAYVAFSRCRTLDGIVLRKQLQPKDIITDERVIDYHERNF